MRIELSDEQLANAKQTLRHNQSYGDANPRKDINPSEEEWDAVLTAAIERVSDSQVQTVQSQHITDKVEIEQSVVGAILYQQAEETAVIEALPFKPKGGQQFRVHPER